VFTALSLLSFATPAEMYKWVDSDGITHYTQSPPPGGVEATTIEPPPKVDTEAARKALEQRRQMLQEARQSRLELEQQEKRQAEEEARKKAECEQARARFASYQRPRVNLIDEQGNPVRATEEQRQAELEKSRELVEKLCNR